MPERENINENINENTGRQLIDLFVWHILQLISSERQKKQSLC